MNKQNRRAIYGPRMKPAPVLVRNIQTGEPAKIKAQSQFRKHPSPAEIAAARTPRGGWTRATLASWGIEWPPPRGWRRRLEVEWREIHNDEEPPAHG